MIADLNLFIKEERHLIYLQYHCLVRVGSNYEPEGLHGVSHFIEHMLFKGTSNIPNAKDIAKIFDSIGAYFNAYTDKNKTCCSQKHYRSLRKK